MDRKKLGDNALNRKLPKKKPHVLPEKKGGFGKQRSLAEFQGTVDDLSSCSRMKGGEVVHGDAQSYIGGDSMSGQNRVSVSLDFRSSEELTELKSKLWSELVSVRELMKRIERCSSKKMVVDNGVDVGRPKRIHSELGLVDGSGAGETKTHVIAPLQENSNVASSDKRASVAVQTKKSKGNNSKKNREDLASIFSSASKVFKSCSSLLNKLMKSKGSWLFIEPVDVKGLGLNDYFTIIKHPMDLGTVKSRLTANWYKTPQEFAEDVRLTFQNAMAYNTEGHEINMLAKQLLKMFEEKWVLIIADHLQQLNTRADSAVDLPTPAPPPAGTSPPPTEPPLSAPSLPPTDVMKTVDRSEAALNDAVPEAKSTCLVASGKTRLPKPKAKDPHKRDMTLEEKEKLSASLQNLPPEKLEGVVSIIKKRNPSLSQNDDEIEVDIDTVDTETLWELDRFVIYYKKALSKMRRSGKLAETGMMVEPDLHEKDRADCGFVEVKENEAGSNEGDQEGANAIRSDGSSSSSSDSGLSSSESDTDSSS